MIIVRVFGVHFACCPSKIYFEVQVHIGLFNSESEILDGVIKASHQYLAYQILVYPASPNLYEDDTDSGRELLDPNLHKPHHFPV